MLALALPLFTKKMLRDNFEMCQFISNNRCYYRLLTKIDSVIIDTKKEGAWAIASIRYWNK